MPSPVLSPQQDAYEPESSASYTYPPQQNGQAYGYVPTSCVNLYVILPDGLELMAR